jgi:flagellar hook-associated protein 2
MLGVVSDPKSTVTTYGATMVGNSIVGQVRSQMRAMITGNSDAPAGGLSAMRDLGLSIDNAGTLVLDSAKLNTVLKTKFESAVRLLSANQENQSIYSVATRGIAGAASKKLTDMLGNSGVIKQHSDNASKQNSKYQADLTNLQTRMDALLVRYQKQFSAMDSIVGKITGQKTSLKSSFEGLMSMYTNK